MPHRLFSKLLAGMFILLPLPVQAMKADLVLENLLVYKQKSGPEPAVCLEGRVKNISGRPQESINPTVDYYTAQGEHIESRYFQEVTKEAEQKGLQKGRQEAKLEAVSKLLQLGLTVEQVAAALNLSVAQVRQSVGRENSD